MKTRKHRIIFTGLLSLWLTISIAGFTLAAPRVGVVIDNHSGPEYYPANPGGNQCVACDGGQPYTDGYDHSADGYFAMKYFMQMLGGVQGAIPGFVIDSFSVLPNGAPGAHHQGIILMDRDNPSQIVDDPDYFSGTPYVPTLIDAWGEEGIYVDTSISGADPVTGYISYTDLYMNFTDIDGNAMYIWPQPVPYPSNVDYPALKEAYNSGGVPFYLLPRDAMNAYEDTNFDGGGTLGYGPGWSPPMWGSYLEGPVFEVANSAYYPDNGWNGMLGWEFDLLAPDFMASKTSRNDIDAWEEHDFWEFAGFEIYTKWVRQGGREVYNEEVTGMMNQIKDWVAANYDLTGGGPGTSADLIYVTYMLDPCFCNGVDPRNSIHGKSLYDAVYNLIAVQGADKIIVHDHFVMHSFLMNDDMGWRMIKMAVMNANAASGRTFSFTDDLIFAPGHPPDNQPLADSVYKNYYSRFYIGTKEVPERLACGGLSGPDWSTDQPSPYTVSREEWVSGIGLMPEYRGVILQRMKDEIAWAVADGAVDIALFLSNHGTPTQDSWCADSANDHAHYNHKLHFLLATDAILSDPAFLAANGSVVSKGYGPDAVTDAEIAELKNGMNGTEIATLGKNIKQCLVELSSGRKIAFYRVSGQDGFYKSDKADLSFSPREALHDIMNVQNPAGMHITHVLDILYQFLGQSGDLLYDHRFDGYGEELSCCEYKAAYAGGSPCQTDPALPECPDVRYLSDLALTYPNPIIDDPANPNSWRNFQAVPEQYCYPAAGNPLNPADPCWDYGHDDPACPSPVPDGCYVSLFTVYDDASDPLYDPVSTPLGLRVKITNGSWGFDEKVAASQSTLAVALDLYLDSVPPTILNVTTNQGPDGSPVPLDNGTTICDGSQNIIWTTLDPGYSGNGSGWASRQGVAHTYFSYKLTTDMIWSPELESVQFGNPGFYGLWTWAYPLYSGFPLMIGADGDYNIRLAAEDAAGNRSEVTYQITIDTTDTDGDGEADCIDNCPAVCNPLQLDADLDGLGDLCDPDPGCGGCGAVCEEACLPL